VFKTCRFISTNYRFGLCPKPTLLAPEVYVLASQERWFGTAAAKLTFRALFLSSSPRTNLTCSQGLQPCLARAIVRGFDSADQILQGGKLHEGKIDYRFGDCFCRLAFPPVLGWRRSRTRASRVKNPRFLSIGRNLSLSTFSSARETQWINASSCP
jgi:hypothetical protein